MSNASRRPDRPRQQQGANFEGRRGGFGGRGRGGRGGGGFRGGRGGAGAGAGAGGRGGGGFAGGGDGDSQQGEGDRKFTPFRRHGRGDNRQARDDGGGGGGGGGGFRGRGRGGARGGRGGFGGRGRFRGRSRGLGWPTDLGEFRTRSSKVPVQLPMNIPQEFRDYVYRLYLEKPEAFEQKESPFSHPLLKKGRVDAIIKLQRLRNERQMDPEAVVWHDLEWFTDMYQPSVSPGVLRSASRTARTGPKFFGSEAPAPYFAPIPREMLLRMLMTNPQLMAAQLDHLRTEEGQAALARYTEARNKVVAAISRTRASRVQVTKEGDEKEEGGEAEEATEEDASAEPEGDSEPAAAKQSAQEVLPPPPPGKTIRMWEKIAEKEGWIKPALERWQEASLKAGERVAHDTLVTSRELLQAFLRPLVVSRPMRPNTEDIGHFRVHWITDEDREAEESPSEQQLRRLRKIKAISPPGAVPDWLGGAMEKAEADKKAEKEAARKAAGKGKR